MFAKAFALLRATAAAWSEDNMSSWAAALAFYTMLSIGPMLFVAISTVGLLFGHDAAQSAILGQSGNVMGKEAVYALAVMIREASQPARGAWATGLGGVASPPAFPQGGPSVHRVQSHCDSRVPGAPPLVAWYPHGVSLSARR